jgi:hypothetical protein
MVEGRVVSFFSKLVASNDREVDSVIVLTGGALAAIIFFTAFVVWQDHTSWNPANFGGACAGLIIAGAGGKTARDWNNPSGQSPDPAVASPPGPPVSSRSG